MVRASPLARHVVRGGTMLSTVVLVLLAALLFSGGRSWSVRPAAGTLGDPGAPYRVLVFSRTTGCRHDAIPDAAAALGALGAEHGFAVDAAEDPTVFDDARLAPYRAVIFLVTTGDVLDPSQQTAFERYIRAGNGYVGVHSASDTEYDWTWCGGPVGCHF